VGSLAPVTVPVRAEGAQAGELLAVRVTVGVVMGAVVDGGDMVDGEVGSALVPSAQAAIVRRRAKWLGRGVLIRKDK